MNELIAAEQEALRALFDHEGWQVLQREMTEHLDTLCKTGLDSPSWDALNYNRGVRDTLRVLLHRDAFLAAMAGSEPEDDPV